MHTVRLGRTGLDATAVGLGCGGHSRLGLATGQHEAHAVRIVQHALDLGIRFVDTARSYGTEAAVGKALRGRRDDVVLSTKASVGRGDHLVSAADLAASLDESLRQLGTDHVDIFHLHGVALEHYAHCIDVLLPALKRAQEAGKTRFLGITERFAGDTSHRMLQRALPDDHFDVVMAGFNVLNPSARRTVFPLTMQRGVGTLIMFAVRRALSREDALREVVADLVAQGVVDRVVDRDDGAAGDIDGPVFDPRHPLGFVRDHPDVASIVQAAYRFCRHEPGAHVILTGTGSVEHLTENVASILAPRLPDEVLRRLERMFGGVDSISGN